MFRFYKGDMLTLFSNMFTYNENLHDHFTRQAKNLHIPAVRLNIAKRCISYAGTVIWNDFVSIPDVNCSLYTFKGELKKVLITE